MVLDVERRRVVVDAPEDDLGARLVAGDNIDGRQTSLRVDVNRAMNHRCARGGAGVGMLLRRCDRSEILPLERSRAHAIEIANVLGRVDDGGAHLRDDRLRYRRHQLLPRGRALAAVGAIAEQHGLERRLIGGDDGLAHAIGRLIFDFDLHGPHLRLEL